MAVHTAQNFETSNCRKVDDGNPNNSANTDIYAYSETTFCFFTLFLFISICHDNGVVQQANIYTNNAKFKKQNKKTCYDW